MTLVIELRHCLSRPSLILMAEIGNYLTKQKRNQNEYCLSLKYDFFSKYLSFQFEDPLDYSLTELMYIYDTSDQYLIYHTEVVFHLFSRCFVLTSHPISSHFSSFYTTQNTSKYNCRLGIRQQSGYFCKDC